MPSLLCIFFSKDTNKQDSPNYTALVRIEKKEGKNGKYDADHFGCTGVSHLPLFSTF